MRKPKAGQVAPLCRKPPKLINDLHQATSQQQQTVAHLNQFRIVRHKATGCSQMNNRTRPRYLIAPRVNMRHHIVPQFLFVLRGRIEIDGIHTGSHFRQLLIRNF